MRAPWVARRQAAPHATPVAPPTGGSLVAPVPRRNYHRSVAVFCCVFGAGTVPSKGREKRKETCRNRDNHRAEGQPCACVSAATCARIARIAAARRLNTRPSVRRASAAPRAGRCNLISAGRLGRLVAGWRFNRISICLVAASQCRRRRCRRHRRCCSRHTAQHGTHGSTAYGCQALRGQPWTSIFLGHSGVQLCRVRARPRAR